MHKHARQLGARTLLLLQCSVSVELLVPSNLTLWERHRDVVPLRGKATPNCFCLLSEQREGTAEERKETFTSLIITLPETKRPLHSPAPCTSKTNQNKILKKGKGKEETTGLSS